MSLFVVINSGDYWDVVAVNPSDPTDTVLANRCETQAYAEMLASELNRLAEIEAPKPRFKVEMLDVDAVREITFEKDVDDDSGLDQLFSERPD